MSIFKNQDIINSSRRYTFFWHLIAENILFLSVFVFFLVINYTDQFSILWQFVTALTIGIFLEVFLVTIFNKNLWLIRLIPIISGLIGYSFLRNNLQIELDFYLIVLAVFTFLNALILISGINLKSKVQRVIQNIFLFLIKFTSFFVLATHYSVRHDINIKNLTDSNLFLYMLINIFLFLAVILLTNLLLTWRNADLEDKGQRLKQISSWHLSDEVIRKKVEKPESSDLRHATRVVLFADIRGFSAFSEKAQVRQVFYVLTTLYNMAEEIIERHSGFKPEFIADEIVTFFEDPRDAVACAIEMRDTLNKFLENYYLSLGIGINAGDVIEGLLGSPNSRKYTILGNTVNIASRLQSNSAGKQILVNDKFLELVKGLEVQEIRGIKLKNINVPMRFFNIVNWERQV